MKKPARRMKRLKSAWEAARRRGLLKSWYRERYDLAMHPIQSDVSVVPCEEVAACVQSRNKSHAPTFFATGYQQALEYFWELEDHGFPPDRMEKILDFGCGVGRLLIHFFPFKAKLFGCDVNETAIRTGSRTLGRRAALSLTGLLPPLPYAGDFFNLIYANSVFTHIRYDSQEIWMKELRRVLKPSGCLVLTAHPFLEPDQAPSEGWLEKDLQKGAHMDMLFTREKLAELVVRHFRLLEIREQPSGGPHVILTKGDL
ncbi:MAG: class I SAM-dependent methyltransferase [Candidatus Omnitrophica bacterium]|nr:class I SAM-dependent methyltransferase [Candidatus Omnitrophota bacterium]